MINPLTTILHGLLICIPFTIFAVVSFWRWPRLWLHSLPPDIAMMAGPKTEKEEKQTRYLLIPLLLILPGLSLLSTLLVPPAAGANLTFIGAMIHIYGIWIIVHLWDLVVIDGGHVLLIDLQRPPVPGTEGAQGYRDIRFHFRAFLEAVLKSAYFVVPAAFITALLV